MASREVVAAWEAEESIKAAKQSRSRCTFQNVGALFEVDVSRQRIEQRVHFGLGIPAIRTHGGTGSSSGEWMTDGFSRARRPQHSILDAGLEGQELRLQLVAPMLLRAIVVLHHLQLALLLFLLLVLDQGYKAETPTSADRCNARRKEEYH